MLRLHVVELREGACLLESRLAGLHGGEELCQSFGLLHRSKLEDGRLGERGESEGEFHRSIASKVSVSALRLDAAGEHISKATKNEGSWVVSCTPSSVEQVTS
jgi:hypothetical protein